LLDEIILLGLCGNNFIKRPILIKKKVGISVSKHPCTFSGQHEELVSTVGNIESSALVFPTIAQMSGREHFLVTLIISLTWHILVTLWRELVSGVVAHGR